MDEHTRGPSDPAKLVHDLSNLLDGSLRNVSLALHRLDDTAGQIDAAMHGSLKTAEQTLAQMAHMLRGYHAQADEALDLHSPRTVAQASGQVVQLLGPDADAKGIGLHEDLDPAAADRAAGPMSRVLTNAVRNAIEAINRDGQIWIHADLLEDDWLEVRIEDDGPGVAPFLTRDRDGLVMAGQTTKATRSGHGLGLAICRDMVRACGGVIRLEARDAGGTVLLVRIPPDAEARS